MKQGDILVCEGYGKLSNGIKRYQKYICNAIPPGVWLSHVAMMCSKTHVFETTTLNEWCGKKGAQCNPANEWLHHYNGRIWIRRQRIEIPDAYRIPKIIEDNFPDGFPYENGIPGLLELLFTGIPWIKYKTKEPHCTEAIATILLDLGVFPADSLIATNKMPPHCWWNHPLLEQYYHEPVLIKP